jgi:anti-sigma regulatory factor (Ser/Thr protein kinase)
MSEHATHHDHVSIARSPGRVELKMSSHPATLRPVRHALEQFCRESGATAAESDELGLVLNEALANVMRHQYGGATDKPIAVTFLHRGDEVEINIRDWGAPFDPSRIKLPTGDVPPKPDPDKVKPGGLGLLCMKKLMHSVNFSTQPDGMLLTMVKKLGTAKA